MKENKIYRFVFCVMAILAISTPSGVLAEGSDLRPLPGAEYKNGTLERVIHNVAVENLVEGSPEWTFWKFMQLRLDRNYEALGDYVSPVSLWTYKNESDSALLHIKNLVSFSDPLYVGDAGSDEYSAYIYIYIYIYIVARAGNQGIL